MQHSRVCFNLNACAVPTGSLDVNIPDLFDFEPEPGERRAMFARGPFKEFFTTFLVPFFATAGFVGRSPKAPGTFGTLVAVPIAFLFATIGPSFYLIATALMVIFAIFIASAYEKQRGLHDAQEIVIDEVVGYLIAFAWLPLTWMSLVAAFIVFRVLDILKPFPISRLDQRVKGGLGVVIDDVAAGLIANLILHFIASRTTLLGPEYVAGGGIF
ncbi:MAG: phosphatidylglycerophosphatase A [Bdellovibrionales bacterium]|jgi:phosphatidylglycerophosphatase A|nr:phosphatidylglycerophosphatase A [Bdellovibrionales bacterium]